MPTVLVPVVADPVLVRLDGARTLLAEARSAPEAKRVADIAKAVELLAKQQGLSQDIIDYATEIKVDAVAQMGEFLKHCPKNTGAKGVGTSAVVVDDRTQPPTLSEAGITKDASSEAQTLAEIKATEPELFEQVRGNQKALTTAVRAFRAAKRKVVKVATKTTAAKPEKVPTDRPEVDGDDVQGDLKPGPEWYGPMMEKAERVIRLGRELAEELDVYLRCRGGELLNRQTVTVHGRPFGSRKVTVREPKANRIVEQKGHAALFDLLNVIELARPQSLCAACRGVPDKTANCRACRGLGWSPADWSVLGDRDEQQVMDCGQIRAPWEEVEPVGGPAA